MDSWKVFTVACSSSEKSRIALKICLESVMNVGDRVNALHVYQENKNLELQKSVGALLLMKVVSR
jgi:hypothetical protein